MQLDCIRSGSDPPQEGVLLTLNAKECSVIIFICECFYKNRPNLLSGQMSYRQSSLSFYVYFVLFSLLVIVCFS